MPVTRDRSQADRLRGQLLGPRRYDVLGLDEVLEVGTAQPLAQSVRALLGPVANVAVVDLFAGSGNLMLHTAHELSAAVVVGSGRGCFVVHIQ